MQDRNNITAAWAVDREFVYMEKSKETIIITTTASPECPQRATWTKENKANKSLFFSRKVKPHKFYLSKEDLANCPVFFQEGLMAEILFAERRDGEQSIKLLGRPSCAQENVLKTNHFLGIQDM